MMLSKIEEDVLRLIPAGRENARPGSEIARLAGIDKRDVREIIYDLRVKNRYKIGSSNRQGYFRTTGEVEDKQMYDRIDRQIKKMVETRDVFM